MRNCSFEQFLLFSIIDCHLLLGFHVITGTIFSLRDKRLFEMNEVEITRVVCTVCEKDHFLMKSANHFVRQTSPLSSLAYHFSRNSSMVEKSLNLTLTNGSTWEYNS